MKVFCSIITFLIICSCTTKLEQRPFNKDDWKFIDMDGFFSKRPYMMDDLLNNKLHKEMTYQSVVDLLGKSSYANNSYTKDSIIIKYLIEEIYKWDIDPVAGSYLKIIFGKDSLVTDYKVITWEKGKINGD